MVLGYKLHYGVLCCVFADIFTVFGEKLGVLNSYELRSPKFCEFSTSFVIRKFLKCPGYFRESRHDIRRVDKNLLTKHYLYRFYNLYKLINVRVREYYLRVFVDESRLVERRLCFVCRTRCFLVFCFPPRLMVLTLSLRALTRSLRDLTLRLMAFSSFISFK